MRKLTDQLKPVELPELAGKLMLRVGVVVALLMESVPVVPEVVTVPTLTEVTEPVPSVPAAP